MTKDVLNQLVISEDDLLAEAVDKAKGLLAIEDKSGTVFVRIPKTSLPARSLIHLYLIGTYFSHRMGKADFPSMSPVRLSIASGIEQDTISARLTELVDSGSVKKTEKGPGMYAKGEYYINPYMMNDILDEILSSRASASTLEQGEQYPDVGKHENLTDAIISLLQTPWGKKPRDWREIQLALRHNSMIFTDGSVTGTLTLMYQDRRLRRIKEGRAFKYMVP